MPATLDDILAMLASSEKTALDSDNTLEGVYSATQAQLVTMRDIRATTADILKSMRPGAASGAGIAAGAITASAAMGANIAALHANTRALLITQRPGRGGPGQQQRGMQPPARGPAMKKPEPRGGFVGYGSGSGVVSFNPVSSAVATATSAVTLGFDLVGAASKKLTASFEESAARYRKFSPQLQIAESRQKALDVFADMRNARKLGPNLSAMATTRGGLGRSVENIKVGMADTFYTAALPAMRLVETFVRTIEPDLLQFLTQAKTWIEQVIVQLSNSTDQIIRGSESMVGQMFNALNELIGLLATGLKEVVAGTTSAAAFVAQAIEAVEDVIRKWLRIGEDGNKAWSEQLKDTGKAITESIDQSAYSAGMGVSAAREATVDALHDLLKNMQRVHQEIKKLNGDGSQSLDPWIDSLLGSEIDFADTDGLPSDLPLGGLPAPSAGVPPAAAAWDRGVRTPADFRRRMRGGIPH